MAGKRKVHTAAFKAQVALAALKGDRTVNELAGHYGVHPTLIHGWKKQLLTGAEGIFGSPAQAASADAEARQAELFEQIGRLKMELEWLKKKQRPDIGLETRRKSRCHKLLTGLHLGIVPKRADNAIFKLTLGKIQPAPS